MRHIKKAFIDIFTDGDRDWDYAKVIGTLGLVVFMGISFWSYGLKGKDFAPIEWATGFTMIVAGAAGVSKLRDKTIRSSPTE
ncbi:hypothetical protein DBA29_20325 [Xenophilus aerolatus]|nr:hypothetical protein [Xenophilus aerolatus]